ncbi:hypothetical protein ARHIZOSPH14_32640 [Agromyces rhizosphaerae]|uniref:Uncharacterized protein n=1 Tax=Agromyces rhizosphaerae TaxID=88374 RepID=A0A9W6CYI6_9MICO|nr:hypothetical protein [Agromyces rhizosphaerae]GLI29022.1 hypothetical protein ARHIZOSPH14_32640 [Agromyces rhizosphaerae]
MSGEQATDAPEQADATESMDAPAPTPFAMLTGDPSAAVCEGDACVIPGFGPADS